MGESPLTNMFILVNLPGIVKSGGSDFSYPFVNGYTLINKQTLSHASMRGSVCLFAISFRYSLTSFPCLGFRLALVEPAL